MISETAWVLMKVFYFYAMGQAMWQAGAMLTRGHRVVPVLAVCALFILSSHSA